MRSSPRRVSHARFYLPSVLNPECVTTSRTRPSGTAECGSNDNAADARSERHLRMPRLELRTRRLTSYPRSWRNGTSMVRNYARDESSLGAQIEGYLSDNSSTAQGMHGRRHTLEKTRFTICNRTVIVEICGSIRKVCICTSAGFYKI